MLDRIIDPDVARALIQGEHADPFSILGLQEQSGGGWSIRAWLPGAHAVVAIDPGTERSIVKLQCEDASGLFAAPVPRRRRRFSYRFRVIWQVGEAPAIIDDPYQFKPLLGEVDLWLLAEGTHLRPYEQLGAHLVRVANNAGEGEGIAGTRFAVWAPNARRAAVVGDFNGWDDRRHPMRGRVEAGIWEIFIPGVAAGARYKFALTDVLGAREPWRADPHARQAEFRPATASVVSAMPIVAAPTIVAHASTSTSAPMTIYEVHLGSWRRKVEAGNRFLNWDELADSLIDYVVDMGFTHIELMPISEHPFDGSWGYQPIGLYAPSARFGPPEGLRRFVERCHAARLGVILDWVPGHFPADLHGLARFDGTYLYEHADPREGVHPDWDTLIYNFGRNEVREFLIGNARYWIEQFGIDALRVDAVASMLYRDYSRAPGAWRPNVHGGRENLDAIAFLRRLNEELGATHPNVLTMAEESTAWPGVSKPTSAGGLGFHYKWNMGWMNDTLRYFARDPSHRKFHQNELTFGLLYAFDEQFVLPLSHDEVVHGKGSLVGKMPGNRWQKFANLRAYLGFMYAHPGKKLLFMGAEFGQEREWNHDQSLDWHLLDEPLHRGVQSLVRDLNRLHRTRPALHEYDTQARGFEWIAHDDHEHSVLAFMRHGRAAHATIIAVCNLTPMPHFNYRIGVPIDGGWRECFNSDSSFYGGGDIGNGSAHLTPEPIAAHGQPASLALTLPPLATLFFERAA